MKREKRVTAGRVSIGQGSRSKGKATVYISEDWSEKYIVSDPKIMMGKPVISGTRITVELILEKLAAGESMEQILKEHPRLTRQGILDALAFAAQALKADIIYPVRKKAL